MKTVVGFQGGKILGLRNPMHVARFHRLIDVCSSYRFGRAAIWHCDLALRPGSEAEVVFSQLQVETLCFKKVEREVNVIWQVEVAAS